MKMPKRSREERVNVNLAPMSEHDSESEGEFDGKFPSGFPVKTVSDKNNLKDVSRLLNNLVANGAAVRGTVGQDGKVSFEFHASPKGEGGPKPTKAGGSVSDPPPRYEAHSVPRGGYHKKHHQPRGFFFR
jgi:hypothetical protein